MVGVQNERNVGEIGEDLKDEVVTHEEHEAAQAIGYRLWAFGYRKI